MGFWDVLPVAGTTTREVLDGVTPSGRTRLIARECVACPDATSEAGMNITGDTALVIRSILSGQMREGLSKQLRTPIEQLHRALLHLQNTDLALKKGATRCTTYLWLGETHRQPVHAALIRSTVRAAVLAMSHEWPYQQSSAKALVRVNVYMEHTLSSLTYVRPDDLDEDSKTLLNNSKEGDAPPLVTREEDAVSRVDARWIEQRSRFMLNDVAEMTGESNAQDLQRDLYVVIKGGLHTSHIHSILSPRFPDKNPEPFTRGKHTISHVFINFD